MTRQEVINKLRELTPDLRRRGVISLSMFGSVSRDEFKPSSDIDLIAEFERPHTFKQYFDALFFLEDTLGIHVDLAEPQTLHPMLRERILAEAVAIR